MNLWLKNLFLIGVTSFGIAMLAIYLMASNRIDQPRTFDPDGKSQLDIESVAAQVDRDFQTVWRELNLQPAPPADELTVARRLSLGLAGTLPSVQEIREFERVPEGGRIHWWVSRLLEDRRTSNYIGERLARALVGVEEGPFIVFRRRRFVTWLADQIEQNRPYDLIAKELLTDDGLWTDSPAVNFVTVNIDPNDDEGQPDPIRLAGRTSRAFLGMRIDCLQCHDDFLGTINLGSAEDPSGGEQRDFHSLAAFFGGVETALVGIRDNASPEPYRYQLLDEEEEQVIEPRVPFNRHLDSDDPILRNRLADWATHRENRPFARAIVNRIWAIACGQPLIEPVDDIPLEGPFPPAMETLVDDFLENDCDLHRLIRVIAATKVFGLDSQSQSEITREQANHWAVFPLVRLRPDQVARSIIQSTSLTTIDSTAHIITRLTQFGQQTEFVDRYGDAGEDEFSERGETVTQRLLMLNGNMVQDRLEGALGSPSFVANLSPDMDKAVETVYLATLSRRPTGKELAHFTSQLESLSADAKTDKIRDLYWTLINSIEFVWNH